MARLFVQVGCCVRQPVSTKWRRLLLNSWLREFFMKLRGQVAGNRPQWNPRSSAHSQADTFGQITFEQIYSGATVKPPRIAYGIQKVADMAHSSHLEGMSAEFKRRALLMALNAAGSDEGEVLNDLVVRQRALKEYEDSFLNRVNQFEANQTNQIRLRHEELDKITGQFQARIQTNLDEVEARHREFREWQEAKEQELHRFAEAAALCVPQKNVEEEKAGSNVTTMVATMLRPTGTFR
jgi:hypothetical protein